MIGQLFFDADRLWGIVFPQNGAIIQSRLWWNPQLSLSSSSIVVWHVSISARSPSLDRQPRVRLPQVWVGQSSPSLDFDPIDVRAPRG